DVRIDPLDQRRVDLDPGVDLHAEAPQLPFLVSEKASDFALARCAGGDVDLPAKRVAAPPDAALVPAQPSKPRELHPGRAGADHHQAPWRHARFELPGGLAAGFRIDSAAQILAEGHPVDTGVTGDAGADLLGSAPLYLRRPVGISQQAAAQQHDVGFAVSD